MLPIPSRYAMLMPHLANLYHNYDPNEPDKKLLAMPLGALDAGSYSINMTIVSGDINFDLITYDGQHVATTSKSNGVISFDLAAPDDTVGLIGNTFDSDVDVRYHVQKDSSTTPAATGGIHRNGGTEVRGLRIIGQWLILLVMSGSVMQ